MKTDLSKLSYDRLNTFIDHQTQHSQQQNEVYLTAGGYYQDTYIAIFEDLTSNEGVESGSSQIAVANVDFIAELFVNELLNRYPDRRFPFNKILSVTLPSQIIAKQIFDKLAERNEKISYYDPLHNNGGDPYILDKPTLIRLSSYYSYSEEIQFKNILTGDRVLLVNDVISTGNLINDICNKISSEVDEKTDNIKAVISNVLSVIDSRVPPNEIKAAVHIKSRYFNNHPNLDEGCFISLAKRKIYKYQNNPYPDKKLIRINPILNSRITIESKQSEEDKVAFSDAETFLKILPTESLKIGHFSQNSLHHSYFITPEDLFHEHPISGNAGVRLIKRITREVSTIEKKSDLPFHINSIQIHMKAVQDEMGRMDTAMENQFQTLNCQITKFLEISRQKNSFKSRDSHLNKFGFLDKDDFIFYPVFSGIERLSKESIQEIFGVNYSNIIPLQRFDTNKGWRFIIPQKHYNRRLKGKKALILDMGSFTGDSIIQMIDALCVFELKKILVISLVGRLEDFDREFFSRIREMKVNVFDRRNTTHNSENTVAPVKIYFGTNLHIPPYSSSKVCEHCREISTLEFYKEQHEFRSTSALYYIKKRIISLSPRHTGDIANQCPEYFPRQWDGEYDMLSFFKTRDQLGKIDSYRFYTDYYDHFDSLDPKKSNYQKEIECIIVICLHEKHLISTIKNQLPDVKIKLIRYIKDIISKRKPLSVLHYNWSVTPIVEFYFIINEIKDVFRKQPFSALLDFIDQFSTDKKYDFSFLTFKMAENYYANKSKPFYIQNELIKTVKGIWQDIEDNKQVSYYNLITEFNRLIVNDDITEGNHAVKPFFTLFSIYDDASAYKPSHIELGTDVANLKTMLNAFFIELNDGGSEFNYSLFQNKFDTAKQELGNIIDAINGVDSYLRSLIKLFKRDSFLREYVNGEKSLKKYVSKITDLIIQKGNDYNKLLQVYAILNEIETEYFSISTELNFYSIWKKTNYTSFRDVWQLFRDNNKLDLDFFGKYVNRKDYAAITKSRMKSFSIIQEESYREIAVSMHPYLLIKICKELVDNSLNHSPGSKISVFLSTEINSGTGLTYSKFRYVQEAKASISPKSGLEDVIKIIDDFNGTFNTICLDNISTIEISIPVTVYHTRQ